MSNWQTIEGRDLLRTELRSLEETFLKSNLKWNKINTQKEDALAVTVSIIKGQIRRGLIKLKEGHNPTDAMYQNKSK